MFQRTLRPTYATSTFKYFAGVRSVHSSVLASNQAAAATAAASTTSTQSPSTTNSTIKDAVITLKGQTYDLSPFKLVPKSNLYATIKIFNKPYLITAGDKLTLPHNLKNVDIGSVIKFNDIISIGSRDFVFYPPSDPEAKPILEKLLNIEGTVIEKTKNKARTKVFEKQRCRKDRRTLVKHKKTVIRISDLNLQL